MNAHTFSHDFSLPAANDDRADADLWARVRAIAWALASADLDDDTAVIRALLAAGYSSRDYMPLLDEAIELAKANR